MYSLHLHYNIVRLDFSIVYPLHSWHLLYHQTLREEKTERYQSQQVNFLYTLVMCLCHCVFEHSNTQLCLLQSGQTAWGRKCLYCYPSLFQFAPQGFYCSTCFHFQYWCAQSTLRVVHEAVVSSSCHNFQNYILQPYKRGWQFHQDYSVLHD